MSHNAPPVAYLEITNVTAPIRAFPNYSFTVTIGCFELDEVTPLDNPTTFTPSVQVENYDALGAIANFSSSPWVAGSNSFDLLVIPTSNILDGFDIDIYLSSDTAPVSYQYRGTITTKTVPDINP